MKRRSAVKVSSGNVFRDLGVDAPEEALAKARLCAKLAEAIASRGLTQADAAKILGVDQPKVSALLRGRLAGFSTDRLLRFLTALGSDVRILVRLHPRASSRGRIEVG